MKPAYISLGLLLALLLDQRSHAAGQICPSGSPATDQTHNPAKCGPVTTKIVLAGGTLAFFDIPANPAYGTAAVNAAYFSPDGFNLQGNGGETIPAYTGSVAIKAVVPVNGGVDTLFSSGSVYFSPNGQHLGGGCTGSVCTVLAYDGSSVPAIEIVPVEGGVDAVLAVAGGVEKAYFSADGLNLGGGGSSVPIYAGRVRVAQIVPVDSSSVVTLFSNGAAYYSPDNRTIGGGGNTIPAYRGSMAIQQILKINGSLLTRFSNDAVYLSPNGKNLGGGGSTIAVSNWMQAGPGPFPVRDSAHGAVFHGLLYLSGGFYNSTATDTYSYFDLWRTSSDESGTSWTSIPMQECNGGIPANVTSYPGCWDSYSPLVVWNSQLWALGSSVYSSADGSTWVLRASHDGSTATPAQRGPGENVHSAVLGSNVYYLELEPVPDVQVTSNPNGTPWTDLGVPYGMEPRCGAAVFVSGGMIWIEGGRDALPDCASSTDYTNDIWSSSDGVTWTKATKSPEWAPRQWPCVTTDSSGTTWLVGGYVADFATDSPGTIRFETNLADVWYTKDGLNWKQFKTDVGSQLPDDLSLGLGPRHAPVCYIDEVNNRLVVVAGKTTRQPTPAPPYTAQNPPPVHKHDAGNVSQDVRILQLPNRSVLP
jgi:hypothetical protein